MKLYRICTENKNQAQVEQIVGASFSGFTVFEAAGYWQGQREKSLIIEIVGFEADWKIINSIATTIRDFNKQTCVSVQQLEVEAKFI